MEKPSYSIQRPQIDEFVERGNNSRPKAKKKAASAKEEPKPLPKQLFVLTVQTTIRLAPDLHKAARIACLERGTSLNDLVVQLLEKELGRHG